MNIKIILKNYDTDKEGKCRKKDSWDFIEKTESFNVYDMDYYADRKEATEQAIIKANEIYNIQQYNLRNSL